MKYVPTHPFTVHSLYHSEVEWFYAGFIQVLSISISAIVMILMVFDENLRFSFYQVYTQANYVAYAMLFT